MMYTKPIPGSILQACCRAESGRKRLLPAGRGGFTLIEILMAMAILVIGMTGVTALYAIAVDAHRRAMDNAGVALLAENMLSDISADFTKRDVDDDDKATFAESFIDLNCRYKKIDDDQAYLWEEGADAPNAPGFRCEVSIYPLPRRLWPDAVSSITVPAGVTPALAERFDDPDALARARQEYKFDVWMLDNYWDDGALYEGADYTDLEKLLSQALEYKLVVRIIRGEVEGKEIDTFRTIILPRSVVDQVQQ
ncbi:MAG: prepilin-type N-terminal cleavage/methylation domain-containing protein [Planctomycetes bacterium]|nr:prepilin-type N-terminal cleavage/methylation domain-containing protein [Planctomycetota bacterium]